MLTVSCYLAYSLITLLGDTCFKFTNTSGNNQNIITSLIYACNRVFGKVSVFWGINYGHTVLAGLGFLHRETSVVTPHSCSASVCPRARHTWRSPFPFQLPPSQGRFFVVFSGSLFNPTTFVDRMTSSGRLATSTCPNNTMILIWVFSFPIVA